jgi:hypothetical protein
VIIPRISALSPPVTGLIIEVGVKDMRHPAAALIVAAALICGCDGLSLDKYWRSERYVLLAIDAKSQMNLAFDLKNGTALGLVGPTVFSIGADDKYIVLKQHPATDHHASSVDRSVTKYFIVERTQSPEFRDRKKRVRGPMEKEEFEKLATSLSLPSFNKTFPDLE